MNLKKEHYTITDFSKPAPLLRRLYLIVKNTLCPGMSYLFFLRFYLASKPHLMQITFLTTDGEDAGFFTCTYSFQQLNGHEKVICRVAIGIVEKFQKGNMPFAALCRRIIAYKLKHPYQPVYMVAYLANPFVYAAIARYTAEYWPARQTQSPAFILKLKDSILEAGNMKKNEVSPFVVRIHFKVEMPEKLLHRIYSSNDPDVKFYLRMNPCFENQMGLMTVVPVRWGNVAANIVKAMIIRPLIKQRARIIRVIKALRDII